MCLNTNYSGGGGGYDYGDKKTPEAGQTDGTKDTGEVKQPEPEVKAEVKGNSNATDPAAQYKGKTGITLKTDDEPVLLNFGIFDYRNNNGKEDKGMLDMKLGPQIPMAPGGGFVNPVNGKIAEDTTNADLANIEAMKKAVADSKG